MNVKSILIGFAWLLSIVVAVNLCSTHNVETNTVVQYDTIVSDTTIYSVKYIPKWHTKIDTVIRIDTLTKTDTIEIVKDYNTTYQLIDTLQNADFRLVLTDIISQNKINERSWSYTDLKGVVHQTIFIEKPKAHLLAGATIGYLDEPYFSATAIFIDKSKKAYSFSYDPFHKVFFLGAYWKIF